LLSNVYFALLKDSVLLLLALTLPALEEDLNALVEAPSVSMLSLKPEYSLSKEEILVKLLSLTSGEGNSGVADCCRDLELEATFFFLDALEAELPRRT